METQLNAVISFAGLLTARWRQRLEYAWRALVRDRYGLSEIVGGATEDPLSGWYYFDPFVVPEVISNTTMCPLREGVGILVLTALYPYQEAQPLVRYVTGDLVQVTHTTPRGNNLLAIRPLGRSSFGVHDRTEDQWLLTPRGILEALESFSEIAKEPIFLDAPHVLDKHVIGFPRFAVQSAARRDGGLVVTIGVQVKSQSRSRPEHILKKAIRSEVMRLNPVMAEAVESGRAALHITPVKTLRPSDVGRAE
jgi:hypothetical protein